ncbi:hypothetical protein GC089_03705 [Cellulomonas sp. JZ18]|uniref:hypothetical protein n=1 Tax=Cellulomonas sp. JZ18 TaxID=2654191 RepID=UPI0012D38389|nr:hypothetical protein [Cellulomonas sp. JZ18]QGQ18524.1 hypothetical protein GC089_03705 [Cellulomonas sp. JZ18]
MPRARTGPSVAAPTGRPLWWVRSVHAPAGGADAATVVVHGVASAARPDGTVVDVGAVPAGAALAGRVGRVSARADSLRLLRVELLGEHAPAAPRLVLVERVRPDADPAGAELAAFDHAAVAALAAGVGAYVPPGTVLTAGDAVRLGLRAAAGVGVVAWCPSTGDVRAVHVEPGRRDGAAVATFLLVAAGGACAARDWPPLQGLDVSAGTRAGAGLRVRRRAARRPPAPVPSPRRVPLLPRPVPPQEG